MKQMKKIRKASSKRKSSKKRNQLDSKVLAVVVFFVVLSVAFVFLGNITGYVTSFHNGTTTVSIASSLSISLSDDTIAFGTCTVSNPGILAQSNNTTIGACDGTFPDFMVLINNGNLDANITLNGTNASDFLGMGLTDQDHFNFTINNFSASSICQDNPQVGWQQINETLQNACENLSIGGNAINMSVSLYIPVDADPGAKSAAIQFRAVSP